MSTSYRLHQGALLRVLAALSAAALAFALMPLAGVSADEHDNDNDNDQPEDNDYPEGVVVTEAVAGEAIASIRYAGENRFETAALIARTGWDASDTAIIARHNVFADALAGGYLAGLEDAPVLLVSEQNLQQVTLDALEDLGVDNVILLGGTAAISAGNETALQTQNYAVERIEGPTRYETAAAIATQTDDVGTYQDLRTAIIATGITFADALAMGPVASSQGFPLLLTPSQSLHPAAAEALEDLAIEQVIIAGGTAAVSADVEAEIHALIDAHDDNDDNDDNGNGNGYDEAHENDDPGDVDEDDRVIRVSGPTRVDTAAAIAVWAVTNLGFQVEAHGWARGDDFADALTVGPALGLTLDNPAPVVLVPTPNRLDSGDGANAALAEAVACDTTWVQIAGGTAAISEAIADQIRAALYCPDVAQIELTAETDTAEPGEDVDLTAFVADNTWVGLPDVTVTFEVETATPEAEVEFADDNDTNNDNDNDNDNDNGPSATAVTDADGEATVAATSNTPARVEFIAWAEREDGTVVWSNTVTVNYLPVEMPEPTASFEIEISSAQEVGEGVADDVEPPFTGDATLHLHETLNVVCWDVAIDLESGDPDVDPGSFAAWADGAGIPASHIHSGAFGATGPVVVILGTPDDVTGEDVGCAFTDYDLSAIAADPAGYYYNAHTDVFPGGLVRGQLELDDDNDEGNNG